VQLATVANATWYTPSARFVKEVLPCASVRTEPCLLPVIETSVPEIGPLGPSTVTVTESLPALNDSALAANGKATQEPPLDVSTHASSVATAAAQYPLPALLALQTVGSHTPAPLHV
jgi:hypothetical protein